MSLKTWKEEFYPTPAEHVSAFHAIDHSLVKWRGLRQANLNRHELVRSGFQIVDKDGGEMLRMNQDTCALCVHYLNPPGGTGNVCKTCPLFIVRGGVPCDVGDHLPPYHAFIFRGDPEPMIRLLEEALQAEKAGALVTA